MTEHCLPHLSHQEVMHGMLDVTLSARGPVWSPQCSVVPVSRLKPRDFSEKSVAGAEQMQQEATIS